MASGEARKWYSSYRWQQRRARQLHAEPLCWMCLDEGIVTPATVADHDPPHKGDYEQFWTGTLKSLCAAHHSRDKQRIEAGKPRLRLTESGWPVQA